MAIYVKRKYSNQFELPAEGQHSAVLAAVQDQGFVETKYSEGERVRFVWIVEGEDSKGQPLIAMQSLNKSLHEKSTLFLTIKGATGVEPGDGQIDVEELVGTQAQLVIVHAAGLNRTYANVQSVLKPAPNQRVKIPDGWEPPKVKLAGAKTAKSSTATADYVPQDSDVPF